MSLPDDLVAAADANLEALKAFLVGVECGFARFTLDEYLDAVHRVCRRRNIPMPLKEDLEEEAKELAKRLPRKEFLKAAKALRLTWNYRRAPSPTEFLLEAKDALDRRSNLLAGLRKVIHAVEYRRRGR